MIEELAVVVDVVTAPNPPASPPPPTLAMKPLALLLEPAPNPTIELVDSMITDPSDLIVVPVPKMSD
jgi:hypothetical protein